MSDMLTKAITMAAKAHAGQVDKSGMPYVFHVVRVASSFQDEHLQVVAVLHDVIEDGRMTYEDVKTHFFSDVAEAVSALTRSKAETYMEYIMRLKGNDVARKVKIADIRDNLRPGAEQLRRRYEAALYVLEDEAE